MVNGNSFNALEAQEVIKSLHYVLHKDAENPRYIFNQENPEDTMHIFDPKNSCVLRSFRYFGILALPETKNLSYYKGYITESVENRGNFVRGVVFTNNLDKIAIFHRAPNATINEDYTLMLRDKNKLIYRGGVIPGKGYHYEKEITINPGVNYAPLQLKPHFICPIPENIKLISILAGYNPNFPN